ncbi:MAG: hypothetical protein KJ955_00200 [Nanoarchaeota archaeon]|nr:hypothetical protein [Nanoarchaeota archaeon]
MRQSFLNQKQMADVSAEIGNCRQNIEFYREIIKGLKEKIQNLEIKS